MPNKPRVKNRWQLEAEREAKAGRARAARLGLCRRCSAVILRGLDSNRCALVAQADVEPVTVAGECAALLAGLSTYDRADEGDGRPVLWHRNQFSISDTRRWPVLVEHRCSQSVTTARKIP